jgi:hypothetical protein
MSFVAYWGSPASVARSRTRAERPVQRTEGSSWLPTKVDVAMLAERYLRLRRLPLTDSVLLVTVVVVIAAAVSSGEGGSIANFSLSLHWQWNAWCAVQTELTT